MGSSKQPVCVCVCNIPQTIPWHGCGMLRCVWVVVICGFGVGVILPIQSTQRISAPCGSLFLPKEKLTTRHASKWRVAVLNASGKHVVFLLVSLSQGKEGDRDPKPTPVDPRPRHGAVLALQQRLVAHGPGPSASRPAGWPTKGTRTRKLPQQNRRGMKTNGKRQQTSDCTNQKGKSPRNVGAITHVEGDFEGPGGRSDSVA